MKTRLRIQQVHVPLWVPYLTNDGHAGFTTISSMYTPLRFNWAGSHFGSGGLEPAMARKQQPTLTPWLVLTVFISHLSYRLETLKDKVTKPDWSKRPCWTEELRPRMVFLCAILCTCSLICISQQGTDREELPSKMLCEPQFLGPESPRLQLCDVHNFL